MISGEPSQTALAAARYRAAHQVLDQGRIFADPLALQILGVDAASILSDSEKHAAGRRMRIFIAARTRFAEDALAAAVAQGVRQLVVLGAGLDTYAYRGDYRAQLRIFEVDHPATQAWKRRCLTDAGIPIPDSLTFAPIDFERETLADSLAAAGFDRSQSTYFTWLGVVPYLTPEATWSTLDFIARLPGASQVVFDYSDPPESLPPETRVIHDLRAAQVAALGETWINYLEAAPLRAKLTDLGFSAVDDLGPPQIAALYFPDRTPSAPTRGGHVVLATSSGFTRS